MTSNEMESLYQALKGETKSQNSLLNEFKKLTPAQQDTQGFFHSYFTESTKKPYVWHRFDMYYGVAPNNFGEYFNLCLKNAHEAKEGHDWTGYKVVAVSMDLLNPHLGMTVMQQYCKEVFSPKQKTYINGVKANKEFLAKKGKLYV
jgi:hypothetical protein